MMSCMAVVLAALLLAASPSSAQVLEMRRPFERYEDLKILVGGSIFGPVESELDPSSVRYNVDFNVPADFDGYVSIDYWQLRGGLQIGMLSSIAPFIFWNPIVGNDDFGGPYSRWAGSIGWEGMFAQDKDFDPRKNLQPDNSFYSPTNSFSVMVSYWFGSRGKTLAIDTNYAGRGFVDTNTYRMLSDTSSYQRGQFKPADIPTGDRRMRFSSRNGFSAGVGLGTGKYAGSGPLSKYLNFLFPDSMSLEEKRGQILSVGLNPLLVARYRYNDFIAQLDVAGEDINLGLIYRGFYDWDVEIGTKYLEHIFYRSTRGPNRTGLFIGVRYSPPFEFNSDRFEYGDEVYTPESDSDGDGIPDGDEVNITHTDPNNRDSDNDGLSDGLEIYTYKTNPLDADSDNDGLSDGDEIKNQTRSDPLRWDTDEDGISDGEEVSRGTDPLAPGGGERGR
jgi:hypothetical protein